MDKIYKSEDQDEAAVELVKALTAKLSGKEISCEKGQVELTLTTAEAIPTFKVLRDDTELQFNLLLNVTAVDFLDKTFPLKKGNERFVVVYHLLSLPFKRRLRVKLVVPSETMQVPSVSSLWKSALFMEREVFDMFGVRFEGHPDLRRILMYDEFEGHPLRKDYPIGLKQPRIKLLQPETSNDALKMSRPELVHLKKQRSDSEGGYPLSFGVPPQGATDGGLKIKLQPSVVDIDDDLHSESSIISIGPSHPATHGTVRIVAEVVGESVVNADVEVGYLHRGFEKMAEAGTYAQLLPYTDRLNYVSPLINNVGWCLTVERLLGISVPKRNQYIRVLMSEISRVCDHLTCIGASAMELGAFTVMLYLMQAREYLWDLIEEVTGARLTASYVRIGSLRYDLPVGFEVKLAESFKKVRSLVSMVDRLLSRNRIFLNRMYGVATITPEEALSYGLTGPLLRASGVNYDVRKAFPYCSYEDFDFEVPLGVNGDNYDRYQVRMLEIEQSLRIAEQALSKMPAGEISAEEPAVVLPDKEQVYNTIEGEIRHFKLIIDGVQPPAGEVYLPVEGGNGELAFYTVSDGSGHPYRVHVRAPSFVAMGIFKELLKGLNLADIIATFGMINMIGGECDR